MKRAISTSSLASGKEVKRGAYGLSLTGVDGVEELLVAARGWPTLELVRRLGRSDAREDVLGPETALIRLVGGGELAVERRPLRATYTLPRPISDVELIHPYLAPTAGIVARWLGRESFHAGAFATDEGTWVFLGGKGAGKSSTLAWLAQRGVAIVADDVVVVGDDRVFAGPRTIDLREDGARALGVGERLDGGERERWRVQLDPVAPELPLRGWILSSWGSGPPDLAAVPAPDRLRALARSRVIGVATEAPDLLLRLAALPAFEFRRSPGWDRFERGVESLLAGLPA